MKRETRERRDPSAPPFCRKPFQIRFLQPDSCQLEVRNVIGAQRTIQRLHSLRFGDQLWVEQQV